MKASTRVGAVLAPVSDWSAIAEAAVVADEAGIDAIGLWDHYHSARPEWGYVAGWSAYGALAAVTNRVGLVPMVLNSLHYELGVLAKESSVLSIASGGRFELGIGAGDWPESFAAWGRPYPPAEERLDRLEETIDALRALWSGQPVSREGRYVTLRDATCTPVPPVPPRVVVGAGGSRRTIERALLFADEVNVYDDPSLVAAYRDGAAAAGRPVAVSLFVDWSWDHWPAEVGGELERIRGMGVDRVMISLGGPEMPVRLRTLAKAVDAGKA
jgi:alkanesulfonate monooxygenase SsuD/methylene tetrahydromethanopterin reductase-like flavin-dependent oxidoreductase (luciferase family)